MDEITEQAMINMTAVLESFLPPSIPNTDSTLVLMPTRVKPTGLGGYVGENTVPHASLYGRLIEANIEIILVSSNGIGILQQAVSAITQALLSQDRSTLRTNSIFSVSLDHLSDITHRGTGGNAIDMRTAVLNVVFEYIPLPLLPEGSIDSIVHNSELSLADGKAVFFDLNFAGINASGEDPLSYFDFRDDPDVVGASPSGRWEFDESFGYIEQSRNVRGGASSAATPKKAGAQALVLKNGFPYQSRNLIIKGKMESGEVDGIGFIFRHIDENNFYFFIMSARHDYHLLAKKVSGSYEFLDSGGLNDAIGYTADETMEVKLIIENHKFKVYLNNKFVVEGSDKSIDEAGRVGFLTHRNIAARFYNIQLIDFSQ